jgi:hypothetical protein
LLELLEPGKWRDGMTTEDMRRILGRREIGEDVIMAVLMGLGFWGGFEVDEDRCVKINCTEFRLWISCLCSRVIDQEACGFLKDKFKVDVQPDRRMPSYQIPTELQDNPD